ncbi:type IV pilus modification protein PilV [Pseudomonas sp. BN415]|nr:type IV pilus modification protein PilV [Pseudomonas sp. BN415]
MPGFRARGLAVNKRGEFRGQSGVGLLEVLIALLVLSVGLLGMAAMMVRAHQAEIESYQRAQALVLLEDIAARMTANRPARNCYAQTNPLGSGSSFSGTGCNSIADADLVAWDALLKGAAETQGSSSVGAMVGARGCITGSSESYLVSVAWQGLSETGAPTNTCGQNLYGNDAQRRVVTRTVRFATLD